MWDQTVIWDENKMLFEHRLTYACTTIVMKLKYAEILASTLEVKEGAGICGLLWGGLGDGEQVGAVAT